MHRFYKEGNRADGASFRCVAVGMIYLLFLFVVSHLERITALCYGG